MSALFELLQEQGWAEQTESLWVCLVGTEIAATPSWSPQASSWGPLLCELRSACCASVKPSTSFSSITTQSMDYRSLRQKMGQLRPHSCSASSADLCPAASSLAGPDEVSLADEASMTCGTRCTYPEDASLSRPWNLGQQWVKKMVKISGRQWQWKAARVAKPSRMAQKSDIVTDKQVWGGTWSRRSSRRAGESDHGMLQPAVNVGWLPSVSKLITWLHCNGQNSEDRL